MVMMDEGPHAILVFFNFLSEAQEFGLPISSLAHCEVADSSLQLVRVEPCIDTRTVRCPISLRGLKHKTGNGELDIRISPRYLHMQNVNEWMIVHIENLTVRAFSREHTNGH